MPPETSFSLNNNSPNREIQNVAQEKRMEEKQQQLALKFPGDKNASPDEGQPSCNSAQRSVSAPHPHPGVSARMPAAAQ